MVCLRIQSLSTTTISLCHHAPVSSALNFLIPRLQDLHDHRSVSSAHSRILRYGKSSDTIIGNHLLNAYIRCHQTEDAEKLFDEMQNSWNVVTWTSLMVCFVDAGREGRCLSLFARMRSDVIFLPNSFSLSTVINACALLADEATGRGIHGLVEILGFRLDVVVSTSLIHLYAKLNRVEDAGLVFDEMTVRNVVTWGSIISAYTQNGKANLALHLFGEFLRLKSSHPNHFMFSSAVNASASLGRLGIGKCLHATVIRHGHDGNDVIAGAIVDMYGKCGCIEQSTYVFQRIARPSVIPYTSMIVSAAKYGQAQFAVRIFNEMIVNGVKPNEVTFLGVLHACSHAGLVDKGLQYLRTMENDHGVSPCSKHYICAIDMLGRAGRLEEAYNLSKDFHAADNDALLLWTTLFSNSRMHGRLDLATEARSNIMKLSIRNSNDVAGAYVILSNAYATAGNCDGAMGIRHEMRRRRVRKDPGCSWVEIKNAAYVFYPGNLSPAGERETEVLELMKWVGSKMRDMGYESGGLSGLSNFVDEEETREMMIGVHSERIALAFGLVLAPNKGVIIRVMKNLRICLDCHEAFKLISVILDRTFVVRDLNRFHHFSHGICTCRDYW